MAKFSDIKTKLFRYLNEVIWFQAWGIQEPQKPDVVISNIFYPPNIVLELPTNSFDVSSSSEYVIENGVSTSSLCSGKTAYKLIYVFSRQTYKTYRSLPIKQIEDLIFKASLFLVSQYTLIDPEIINFNIPSGTTTIKIKPGDDIKSDSSLSSSWSVIVTMNFDIDFISNYNEYAPEDFNKLQPPTWDKLDGQADLPDSFIFKGLNLEINRSELPSVNEQDPDTYVLEEILQFRNNQ